MPCVGLQATEADVDQRAGYRGLECWSHLTSDSTLVGASSTVVMMGEVRADDRASQSSSSGSSQTRATAEALHSLFNCQADVNLTSEVCESYSSSEQIGRMEWITKCDPAARRATDTQNQ